MLLQPEVAKTWKSTVKIKAEGGNGPD